MSWASITPFGVPVVPDVKTSSKTSVGAGRGQASTCASQSAGTSSSGSADEGVEAGRREVLEAGLAGVGSHDELLGEQDLGNIFSDSWEMAGFAPVMVDAFALDPENPIILIDQQTGATRNLGGGRRQVAYAIDFSNGGDVKLSDVHLMIDLAAAFGAAHSFQVDQVIACDIAANPNFNGAADKQLLEAGASLEVAAKARIILIVSVYPKPDPPVYTATSVDDGTSQLETFVTSPDSSGVLLGPGVVNALNDYVLFADHNVKLDSISNSVGHVGANDFIEVKNGNSAVAGRRPARRAHDQGPGRDHRRLRHLRRRHRRREERPN